MLLILAMKAFSQGNMITISGGYAFSNIEDTEYEIAWASNNFYKDGWINSAMGGIGFRF
jgi:hypothetical protein